MGKKTELPTRARPWGEFGNRTAQDLDLSWGSTVPAQRLQANKPSHHWRKKAVQHPEVAVSVSLEHLEATTIRLIIHRENQEV